MNYEGQLVHSENKLCAVVMTAIHKTTSLRALAQKCADLENY